MPVELIIDSDIRNERAEIGQLIQQIVENHNPILIAAGSGILSLVHNRIHGEGKRANGSAIGTYSNSYMRVRLKNNRGADRKKILSLTRQMENDFTIVAVSNAVGLGFNNDTNGAKARYMEADYPGTYLLSDTEEQEFVNIIEDYIRDLFA